MRDALIYGMVFRKGMAYIFDCLVFREWCYLRRIRKYGLVGVGIDLLEYNGFAGGSVSLGVSFGASEAKDRLSGFLTSSSCCLMIQM